MKRSTGGRVLLERTSVKDGSLFLRLWTQSSICRFSSSIASRAAGRRELVVDGKQERGFKFATTAQPYIITHPVFPSHHDIYKSALSCFTRNSYLVLTVRATVGRNKVILVFQWKLLRLVDFVLPDNLSFQSTQWLKNTTRIYQFWSGKRLELQPGYLLDLVRVHGCRQPLALRFVLERGVEKQVELDGLSAVEVEAKVGQLLDSWYI